MNSIPAILASYAYIKNFQKNRHQMVFRDWVLDSGAYTAWNIGKPVDLDEYISFCKMIRATDSTLSEIIALDVIGCGRGSLLNAYKMKQAGVDVVPVFHIGDDWGILKEYAAGWNKIGLSCRFGEKITDSYRFLDKCFSTAWPKKFHSFGWVSETMLMRYPFQSSDASSWQLQPSAYGLWKEFGRIKLRGKVDIRSQIKWFLKLEQALTDKWGSLLKGQGWDKQVDVRLATTSDSTAVRALRRTVHD
jgi:hypothetical protein